MTTVLIGYTGFVGGHLASRARFDFLVNSSNLDVLRGRAVDRVICAGLPAAKWIANRDPAADRANMLRLRDTLATVAARSFVLISTIDVYPVTRGVDEGFDCGSAPNHAYGRHRLEFELFVRERFPGALILRLPALFGEGLRKNVLFDLLTGNQLERINPASRFQWYPLERLPEDIGRAERAGLTLANVFTEPIATRRILDYCFPDAQVGSEAQPAAEYDLHTRHAAVFHGNGRYVMDAGEVLEGIAAFCGATG